MIPAYRPAFGFALWIGATLADFAIVGGAAEGALSLAGFGIALAWSQYYLAGDERSPESRLEAGEGRGAPYQTPREQYRRENGGEP